MSTSPISESPGQQPSSPEDVLDDEDFCSTQSFDEHDKQSERFRKTLYYGELPQYADRPSLALTSLALEFFTKSLPPRDELRFLDMEYASRVMRQAYVTPSSVVIALMYADRLRQNNPKYMAQANSCDLFLVSMLVASKFLYDDGTDDEICNWQWASAGGLKPWQLNREERNFLEAIQWKLMIKTSEFESVVADMEKRIALKELSRRKDPTLTYTELDVLTKQSRPIYSLYAALYDHLLKVVSVSLMSYCACLLTVFASVAAVNYVIPVLEKSEVKRTAPSTETSNGVITSDSSSSYSAVLLDHQGELEIILRRDFNPENSTFCCLRNPDENGLAMVQRNGAEFAGSKALEWFTEGKILTHLGMVSDKVFPFTREPQVIYA